VRVCVLGPVEVWEDGRELALGPVRQRALFALLYLHAGDVVSTDRLIDGLWGERTPASAAKLLQGYVSQLRRALPPETIVTRGSGYLLRACESDAAEFERLVDRAGAEAPESAARTLREALALWRGGALSDVEYEGWAQAEIARLEELRLVALEQRIDADLRLGEAARVLPELETVVAGHPLREGLRAQLMLALYRAGRQTEALEVFADTRRRLVDELGIEPGRSLRELHQAILRQDPALDLAVQAEPAAERARNPFVGREAELVQLTDGLEDAIAGRGRLFFFAGEPGIGKSRLADEVIRQATQRGMRVLIGRCWEAGGAPAYWPWVQSLRSYARDTEPEQLRAQLGAGAVELAQIVPELRELLPGLPEPVSAESEGARFRLFDATAEFLRNAALARPILLVLDDLHAADASSLLLLQFVARELGSARMLVLGAYRDVDPLPEQSLNDMLAEVGREPTARKLALGALSGQNVAEYLDRVVGAGSTELAVALHEETEGNPLFLTETVRLLSVEGERVALPQTVRDVIARRLTHLSKECNRTLLLASVLGREFALAALSRLSGAPEDEVLATIDEAMIARVVSDVPGDPGRFRFAHVLIRDTLFDGMTAARRVALHRQAVVALTALHGEESGPHLAEVAHHAIAGSDVENGVLYARRAGDRAFLLLAYEEAARLYQTALEALNLLGSMDDELQCTLLLSLGEAEARAGHVAAAKAAFLGAADIARHVGLPQQLARAAAGYGGRIVWSRAGEDELLVPLLEEGLAALNDEDIEHRVRLLARLAGALRDEHSRDRRDALSKQAVELARGTGNIAALAYALDGRAAAIIAADTAPEVLALGTELSAVAARSGDLERVLAGHTWRFMAQLIIGDVIGAEVDLAAATAIAAELKQPVYSWQAAASTLMLALARGRLDEAADRIPSAFALGESAYRDMAITHDRLHRYTLCDFRGTLPQIESEIRALTAEYPTRPVFRCVLALLEAALGKPHAKQTLDELAAGEFSFLPFDQEWLFGMSFLAEACELVGDAGIAATLYPLLEPWASFNAVDVGEGIRGSVSRYLGILAAMLARWEEAERHFEHALAANERMGLRPWLAHTQMDYGRMLLARNNPGDSELARTLVATAQSTYRELAMKGHVEANAAG
jgi:DNA-binding SARP family transcriptional activator/tetratricopeptide (TPR) repeat protein